MSVRPRLWGPKNMKSTDLSVLFYVLSVDKLEIIILPHQIQSHLNYPRY